METIDLAASLAAIAGASLFYLGSPRQLVLARPLPARRSRAGALALLVLAWAGWCVRLHPAAAFFAVLTLGMAACVAVPPLAAMLTRRTGR